MKEEFLTVRGKVIIENDKLVIDNFIPPRYNDAYWVAWLVTIAFSRFFRNDGVPAIDYLLMGITILPIVIGLADVYYRNRWKNKFNLRDIRSFKSTGDRNGLETHVVLTFRSGTEKLIKFRTSEKYFERLQDAISRSITQLQTS